MHTLQENVELWRGQRRLLIGQGNIWTTRCTELRMTLQVKMNRITRSILGKLQLRMRLKTCGLLCAAISTANHDLNHESLQAVNGPDRFSLGRESVCVLYSILTSRRLPSMSRQRTEAMLERAQQAQDRAFDRRLDGGSRLSPYADLR